MTIYLSENNPRLSNNIKKRSHMADLKLIRNALTITYIKEANKLATETVIPASELGRLSI